MGEVAQINGFLGGLGNLLKSGLCAGSPYQMPMTCLRMANSPMW